MNSPLNQITKRLDEIDAARDKATQGKVSIERRAFDCGYFNFIGHSGKDIFWCLESLDMKAKKNAEFIALSLNEIKALTAALRVACEAINHYLEVQKFLAEPNEDNCASSNDFKEALNKIADKLKGDL